jgi:serine/threonine-protein kinase ATR
MSSASKISLRGESSSDSEPDGRARKRQRLSGPDPVPAAADISQLVMTNIYNTIGRYPENELEQFDAIFL